MTSCANREYGADTDGDAEGGAGGDSPNSGGSTAGTDELRVDGELPQASFNLAYSEALEVEGAEGDVEFELTDGALPRGLSLSSDGVISGKPLEDGDFDFTIAARDEAEKSDSVHLSLRVVRHPWLVFLADEDATGQSSLYAVDTSRTQLEPQRLNPDLETGESISWSAFRFSANGESLAFTVEDADDRGRLYVVDFSEGDPSDARLVPTSPDGSVGGFGLTPDGTAIAFHVTEDSGESWQLLYLPLSDIEAEPTVVDAASGGYTVEWLTNERIIYGTGDGNATRLLDGDDFGAASPLNSGSIEAMHRATERVLFTQAVTTCAKRGWLYDFLDGGRESSAPADGGYHWPSYDSRLTRVTHSDGNSGAFIFDAMETDGDPLGLVSPGSACGNVHWSPDGSRVVQSSGESTPRFIASALGDSFDSEPIEGDYVINYDQGGFLDADRFVFASGNTIQEADLSGELEALPLFEPAEDSPSITYFAVAPDHSWIFFFGAGDASGTPGPFALDVRDGEVGDPRRLVTSNPGSLVNGSRYFGTPTSAPSWSPDSSRLAFVSTYGSPASSRLFVADLLHDTALALRVSGGTCFSGEPVRCQQVTSLLFQP